MNLRVRAFVSENFRHCQIIFSIVWGLHAIKYCLQNPPDYVYKSIPSSTDDMSNSLKLVTVKANSFCTKLKYVFSAFDSFLVRSQLPNDPFLWSNTKCFRNCNTFEVLSPVNLHLCTSFLSKHVLGPLKKFCLHQHKSEKTHILQNLFLQNICNSHLF